MQVFFVLIDKKHRPKGIPQDVRVLANFWTRMILIYE